MTVRVQIKPELLKWAYNRTIKQDKLHNKFPKLDEWLNGNIKPTLKQLEEYANATSTPLGYLFLEKPPVEQLPIPHYRTIDKGMRKQPSPDLIETLHLMQRRQDFMKDYFERYIGDSLDFVGSYQGNKASQLANKISELFGIKSEWASKQRTFQEALNYLISKCEENRIMVMVNGIVGSNTHRPLNIEEFRGFVLVDDMAPLIFINGVDAKSAQIFTLIHEIAHIFIGSSAVVEASPLNKVDEQVEKLCNAAAAEFLCPHDTFKKAWYAHYGDRNVYKTLADIFKVSQLVIGRRALDLGIISKKGFFDFYHRYLEENQTKRNSTSSGGNFHNTTRIRLGELFSKAIIYQTKSGNMQFTDAYKLTGLKRSTFQNYTSYIEGRGV
ncbi:ImmA/IrrE family metallo-endopeptidase [Bacillus paralicheniformis]|uniref:ImmA/IrrE family metallo-endopeptidase n=1 Tax=Bacillus paralicheniformis TaxID=1648923 RepID=UPI0019B184F3|nr:ImmA/IrrE family metallo-endopeptidase [Robertmurraya crescens]MED1178465.1 ImmA/IrrE family metallo-endopeptidase [Bacillus paralicheniformis]